MNDQMKCIKTLGKRSVLFLLILIMSGCEEVKNTNESEKPGTSFFVGTYTDSTSLGIYHYRLSGDSIQPLGLAASTVNPSFLALSHDKQFLLAVNETNENGTGAVESYLISGDSLSFINRSESGGGHPCFVSVNSDGYVLVANYTGGNVGLLKISETGTLSPLLDVQQHVGKGSTPRQDAPHAHSAWFIPHQKGVISVDLGTNKLLFSYIDTVSQRFWSPNPNKYQMAPGDGPRHLAFHPAHDWVYVINELSCTVTQLQKTEQNSYKKVMSVSTLPEGYKQPNTCADIHISSDGRFLYASNRGHNSLAIYEINDDDGTLKRLAFQSTRGDGPRNFTLTPDENYIIVANQQSNNLVLFQRDKETGLLTYILEVTAPNPVCILFIENHQ